MPDERFRLEADLRATVRADGWEAYAWDTGNTWRYDAIQRVWILLRLIQNIPTSSTAVNTLLEQNMYQVAIPGGSLGNNGVVLSETIGVLNASGAGTCTFTLGVYLTNGTDTLTASVAVADNFALDAVFLVDIRILNRDDPTMQSGYARFTIGPPTHTTLEGFGLFAYGGTGVFDTGRDWSMRLTMTMNVADPLDTWAAHRGLLQATHIP